MSGSYLFEVDRLKAEIQRLRAINAELVEALKGALEFLPAISALPTKTRTRVGDVTKAVHEALAKALDENAAGGGA